MCTDSEKFMFRCSVGKWKKEIELRTQVEKVMLQKTDGNSTDTRQMATQPYITVAILNIKLNTEMRSHS